MGFTLPTVTFIQKLYQVCVLVFKLIVWVLVLLLIPDVTKMLNLLLILRVPGMGLVLYTKRNTIEIRRQ